MVDKKNNAWIWVAVIIAGAIIIGAIILSFGKTNLGSSSTENGGIIFSSECKFNLVGGQFGGTQGEDSLSCTFRNEGTKAGEKCFNIKEVKIDGAVETTIAEYKNICSGVLNSWERSSEKIIYEPKTYRVFDDSNCGIVGKNSASWTCKIEGSNREIEYLVKAEPVN